MSPMNEKNQGKDSSQEMGKESHRHLLFVLFWLFQTLLFASFVVPFAVDRLPGPSVIEAAAAVTCLFSVVGLLIVCFLLRRMARPLATIGWLSLLISILAGLCLPAIA